MALHFVSFHLVSWFLPPPCRSQEELSLALKEVKAVRSVAEELRGIVLQLAQAQATQLQMIERLTERQRETEGKPEDGSRTEGAL